MIWMPCFISILFSQLSKLNTKAFLVTCSCHYHALLMLGLLLSICVEDPDFAQMSLRQPLKDYQRGSLKETSCEWK